MDGSKGECLLFDVQCGVDDIGRVDAHALAQIGAVADLTEAVLNAETVHLAGALLSEHLGDGAAEAADDGVVLDRDDRAGLLGRAANGVRVAGGAGVPVDNARQPAASRHCVSITPEEMIVTSLPSRRVSALPSTNL